MPNSAGALAPNTLTALKIVSVKSSAPKQFDVLKPLQNKKDQKNLGYPRKKQSFYKDKDCFFLELVIQYLEFIWRYTNISEQQIRCTQ